MARETTLYRILENSALQYAEAPMLLSPGRSALTYRALYQHVSATAELLQENGFGKNDRIALVLGNGAEMASAFLTVTACAACAPLNPAYTAKEFRFYLTDLKITALLVQDGIDTIAADVAHTLGIPVIRLIPETDAPAGMFQLHFEKSSAPKARYRSEAEDIAIIMHTSGTTSKPKVVPLLQRNLCAAAYNMGVALALDSRDRCLNVMPLFHIHGLSTVYASLAAGGSVVCPPEFQAPRFFDWLEDFQPTWYTAAPTIHQALLARAPQHAAIVARHPLRFIRSASSSLAPQVLRELEQTFQAPVIVSYGMTETAPQVSSNPLPPALRKPGSAGIAAGPEVAIMDEAGQLLPPGQEGEVVVRGENVMPGYENNEIANKSAFVDGWFRSGDQGFLDTDGYLFITGRIKEIINRGGEKIAPREVDEVLMEHPAVNTAVCFAMPDARLGEDIAAAVILRDNCTITERDLREFAAQHLAFFKVPSRIVFVNEIPKGHTGKIQRIGLAEKLGLLPPQLDNTLRINEPLVLPRNDVETALAEIWSDVLGHKQISIHEDFFQVGGDSVLAVLLISRIRETLGVDVSLIEFFEALSIAKLADQIIEKEIAQADPAYLENLLLELEGNVLVGLPATGMAAEK